MTGRKRFLCSLAAGVTVAATATITAGAAAGAAADDSRDAAVFLPVLNDTLETQRRGVEVPWSNPETGQSGTIRIERTYYRGQQPCRDYTRKTERGGASTEVNGTGCRVGAGRWDVLEKDTQADAVPAGSERSRYGPGGAGPPQTDAAAPPAARTEDVVAVRPIPPRKPPTYTLPARSQLRSQW